jgi:hypothetical protein
MRGQRFHRVEDEEDEHKSAGGKKGRKGENTPESERGSRLDDLQYTPCT